MTNNEDIVAQLRRLIEEENEKQTRILKEEFTTIKEAIALQQEKINKLQNEVEQLKEKNRNLELDQKKNNIIIFNLEYSTGGDLLQDTITKLNQILKIKLSENDVNNIYTTGKEITNKPIIVQFVSYLKKSLVLKNCINLKGTNIKITDQLSPEQRQERKTLIKYLKKARSQQKKAHIRGNKLFIEGKRYTLNDLIDLEAKEEDHNIVEEGTNIPQQLLSNQQEIDHPLD